MSKKSRPTIAGIRLPLSSNAGAKLVAISVAKRDELLRTLPELFRRAYVKDEDLLRALGLLRQSGAATALAEQISLYVPTKPSIRSAEFGEILTFLLLKEWRSTNGPEKWQWKEAKDTPVQFSDVVLIRCTLNDPKPSDLLLCAEVKTKATATKAHPVEAAIKDAEKDYATRLARTLGWLRARYQKRGNAQVVAAFDRFINSPDHGAYKKEFKAVAVLDASLVEAELSKPRPSASECAQVELIVVSVPSLKQTYNRVMDAVPGSLGDGVHDTE